MLTIITAFEIEANPIINHFLLSEDSEIGSHRVFAGSEIQLGICGMGIQNARRLTRILLAQERAKKDADRYWLNFGIAGSANWKPGELVFAKSVTEAGSHKTWNLDVPFGGAARLGDVYTVSEPQYTYDDQNVYEMEAAGMVSELAEMGNSNGVFVLKLISDGPESPLGSLSKFEVKHLLATKTSDIIDIIDMIINPAAVATIPTENVPSYFT